MSLSWRKRQAIASDQQTWRGLGHDSALWTSIENNASTVNTVVAGPNQASRSGIVTGLRFMKNSGLTTFGAMNFTQNVFVSDPSDSTIASLSGVNQYSTLHPVKGSGLIFSFRKFGTEPFDGAALGTDISGTKYLIHNGGSGYSVGDDILLAGNGSELGRQVTITNANTDNNSQLTPQLPTTQILADNIITQDAFNVIEVTITNPNVNQWPTNPQTIMAGLPVRIHSVTAANTPSVSNALATGFVSSSNTSSFLAANGDTTLRIDVPAGVDFSQTALSISLDIGLLTGLTGAFTPAAFDAFVVGSIVSSSQQAIGFTHDTIPQTQLVSGGIISQTEVEFQKQPFQVAGAPLRNSAGVIVFSAAEMSRTYTAGLPAHSVTYTPGVTNIRTVSPVLGTGLLFNGILTARVTSVADTTPVQGRN